MKFEHKHFLSEYAKIYDGLTPNQVDGLQSLLRFIEVDAEIQNLGWAAYLLDTVKHECADTWQPIVERRTVDYFNKYDAGTPIGQRLGTTQTADGYRFRGRGYVQITGRVNYSKMNQAFGLGGAFIDKLGKPSIRIPLTGSCPTACARVLSPESVGTVHYRYAKRL